MTNDRKESVVLNQRHTLAEFEDKFRKPKGGDPETVDKTTLIKNYLKNYDVRGGILSCIPIVDTLANYNVKEYLINDVISGIIVGVTIIPQSIAFATSSTLPIYVGLYMAFFAPLSYLIFGSSRHLTCGNVAVISVMIANILDKYDHSPDALSFLSNLNRSLSSKNYSYYAELPSGWINVNNTMYRALGDGEAVGNYTAGKEDDTVIKDFIDARRIEVACGISVVCGVILVAASVIGQNNITSLLSNSLMTGFTVGVCVQILITQTIDLLGISIKKYRGNGSIFLTLVAILQHLPDTNVPVLIMSVISFFVLIVVKKFVNEKYKHKLKLPIPIDLIVVAAATFVSYFISFHRTYDGKVVGSIPPGMPKPSVPDMSLVVDYIADGTLMVFVAYAQSLAVAKTLALEYGYDIDLKQETLATGIGSIVCGLFSGYTPAASITMSVIQASAGGKTNVAAFFASMSVLLVILVLGPYMQYLPNCVMAVIIVVNLKGILAKLFLLPEEWRRSRYDCAIWVFTFVITIVFDSGPALIISVAFSLSLVIFRTVWRPVVEVNQIKTDTASVQLRSVANYKSTETLQGVTFIRVKTPVYFVNASEFSRQVFSKVNVNPLRVKRDARMLDSCNDDYELDCESKMEAHLLKTKNGVVSNEQSHLVTMKTLVMDLSPVAFMDTMGVEALDYVISEFHSIGIQVLVTSIPEHLFPILQSMEFWARHKKQLFIDVPAALASMATTVENYKTWK